MDTNSLLLLEYLMYRNPVQMFVKSIGLTNVVLVDDLREPVMYIDIDERKKQVAFFPNLIEKD